jgi:hypothetical protein
MKKLYILLHLILLQTYCTSWQLFAMQEEALFKCMNLQKSLFNACSNKNLPLVQATLEIAEHDDKLCELVNSRAPTPSLETPLHIASRNDYEAIAELLILYGAKIEALNKINEPPLHVLKQHNKTMDLLISCGANINSYDKENISLLHGAVLYCIPIQTLIDNGANIDAQDSNHKTPLQYAVTGAIDFQTLSLDQQNKQSNLYAINNHNICTLIKLGARTDQITDTRELAYIANLLEKNPN